MLHFVNFFSKCSIYYRLFEMMMGILVQFFFHRCQIASKKVALLYINVGKLFLRMYYTLLHSMQT